MRLFGKILAGVLLLCLGSVLTLAYFLTTEKGGKIAVSFFAQAKLVEPEVLPEPTSGTLLEGIIWKDVVMDLPQDFPYHGKVKVQNAELKINGLSLEEVTLTVENARLVVEGYEPIVLQGRLENGLIDFNLFSAGLSLHQIRPFLPPKAWMDVVAADLKQIDLFLKGAVDAPRLTGSAEVEQITYRKNVKAGGQNLVADTLITGLGGGALGMRGKINISKGWLQLPYSKLSTTQGFVLFQGNPAEPEFELNAETRIENTFIKARAFGNPAKQDVEVSSDPKYTKEKIYLMLATGKKWSGVESSLDSGAVDKNVSRDFLDFVLNGKKEKFLKKTGLEDISAFADKTSKGVAVKKKVAGQAEVEYQIQKEQLSEEAGTTTQKVRGTVPLNQNMRLEAEASSSKDSGGESDKKAETESNIMLKYQKSF